MLPPFPTAEWTLGAQNALEAGDELPHFPTAAGATPSGPQSRGNMEQGGAAGIAFETRRTEGGRDATLAEQVGISQARLSTASAAFAAGRFPRPVGSASPSLEGKR